MNASLTRRTLAKQLAGMLFTAVAVRMGVPRALGRAGDSKPLPIVSFFLDQPYLDTSGVGEPFQPPAGLRAGQPLAGLSASEFRNIHPHA